MDYERENAKEWQFNPASMPDSGHAGSERSDDDYDDYADALTPIDQNETQEDVESGWEEVKYKKPPKQTKPLGNVPPAAKAPAPVRMIPPKQPTKLSPKKPIARFSFTLVPTAPSKLPTRTPIKFPTVLPAKLPAKLPVKLPVVTVPLPNRPRPQAPAKSRPTFAFKNDNPAKAAFRAQQPHTGTFGLTRHWHTIETDQKKIYNKLEEMGVRLGSFIRPPQSASDRNLLLWGDDEQIAATIQELQKWVTENDPSNFATHTTKGGKLFAKTGLQIQEKAKSMDQQMRWLATKQKYQKAPESSLSFDFTGYFLWPVDEIRPEDLLGPSYEAFDWLRIRYDSYIVFDNQHSMFKILTNEEGNVNEVMKRIEGTMKEFAARNHREIVVHLVERPDPPRMRTNVMLMEGEGPAFGQSSEKAAIPLLCGEPLAPAQLVRWKREVKAAEEYQFAQWRHLMAKVIKRLHLYRGRIQIRVLLGTFALTQFRRLPKGADSIPFDKFLNDINLTNTKGRMIKDLQLKESPQILLGKICKATKLFSPVDALTTKLEDVSPVYTGCFEFDISGTGKVKLEVESSRIPNSNSGDFLETTLSQWTRRIDKSETVQPLEVFMIRLLGGISWELQISTPQALDTSRITPTMTTFRKNIKTKQFPKGSKPDISGLKVFSWNPGLPISSFEQKTSLRYRLVNNSDWMFEFARYDQYGGENPLIPTSTSWGATFWNSEWDRTLGKNADLKIGDPAKWDPQLDTFFPRSRSTLRDSKEAAGFRQFLANTRAIVELLDGVQS